MIKIWVDDERPAPAWHNIRCHSVYETLVMLGYTYHKSPAYIELSLDHDAGEYVTEGGDYINILKALSQPWGSYFFTSAHPLRVHFHSANPVGVKNMRAIVQNCPWMEEV